MDHDNSKNVDFKMREHGGVNIEVEGNDTIEEDHGDKDDDDDIDADLDVHILEKAHEPLYKGSQTTLLFIVFFFCELEGYEKFVQCSNDTYVKVCHLYSFFSRNSLTINIG